MSISTDAMLKLAMYCGKNGKDYDEVLASLIDSFLKEKEAKDTPVPQEAGPEITEVVVEDFEIREYLGNPNYWVCDLSYGAMEDTPVWESHKRGKNWAAIVHRDPSKPGGLGRLFIEKAKGEKHFYLAKAIKEGQQLEFGADYYRGSGRKCPERSFFEVHKINSKYLVLRRITETEVK